MNILALAFQEILYRPVLNLLVFLYQLPYVDFGIAIILLTILIRLFLWPLNSKAIVSQREVQEKTQGVQEKMAEIKAKYKDDKVRQNEEIVKVWKEKKFNPFSSFVPMVAQIVILIALYQVLRHILQPDGLNLLYSFIQSPGEISPMFLKFLDLGKASPVLAILTGISQYFYSKMTFAAQKKISKRKQKRLPKDAKNDQMQKMQKMMQTQMIYFLPILTVVICWGLQAALPLYWLTSTVIGIFQQKMIYKKLDETKK